MRQRHWMEFLEEYDFQLMYHPDKANVMEDVLSRKKIHMSTLMVKELELVENFRETCMWRWIIDRGRTRIK